MSNVLIADDHAVVRAGYRQFLEAEPTITEVGEATSGSAALAELRRKNWDLLLMDIHMPDRSGIDILKHVSTGYPKVRVLIMSGLPEEQYARNVLRAGARGYVNNRQTADEVVIALRRILAGGVYVNEAFAATLTSGLNRHRSVDAGDEMTLLSDRELEVFRMLAAGNKNSEIAAELSVSLKTVQSYCARIKEKLNLSNATELLQAATRWADAQNNG